MTGPSYKPSWYEPTSRGSSNVANISYAATTPEQQKYEEENRIEIGTSGMTRTEREAIEEQRLHDLKFEQVNASDYHGYNSPNYIPPISESQRFAHSDPLNASMYAYRPPTNWDYERDVPVVSYYQHYGEPSLAELDAGNEELDELIASGAFSPEEIKKLEKLQDDWNAGLVSPRSLQVKDMYADANVKNRNHRQDILDARGITSYVPDQVTNLSEAKYVADLVYMEFLENERQEILEYLEKNPHKDPYAEGSKLLIVEELIAEGPPDFNTAEEINRYYNSPTSSTFRSAADVQKLVVEDWIDRAQNLGTDMQDKLWSGKSFKVGDSNVLHPINLSTGTMAGAPEPKDVMNIGEFGTYGNYSYDLPEKSTFEQVLNVGLTVLAMTNPALAPAIAGTKTLIAGGDIEDALKSAGTAWAMGKVAEIAEPQIAKVFEGVGIDVYDLPVAVQNVIFDTTIDVLEGDSFQESVKENIAKETLSTVAEPVEEVFDDIFADLQERLPAVLKAPIEFVADTLEPVVDVIDDGIDYIGEEYVDPALAVVGQAVGPTVERFREWSEPVIETVKEVGRDVDEEIIQPTLDVAQEVTEPVVDAIDDVIDDFGEEVVDPVLQTTKEVGQDIIDPIDDIIDAIDSPLGDVAEAVVDVITPDISGSFTGAEMPNFSMNLTGTGGLLGGSQISSLFDDDLIKLDKMKSTQEMLTPFINLRKYG